MSDNDLRKELNETSGSDFFDILGKRLKCVIPKTLKNILSFNHYDTIFTLSEFNEDSINEIQECMRQVFEKDMLDENENITDYLGKFAKVQQKFIIVSGELRLIKCMAETCRQLYALQPEFNPSSQHSSSTEPDENEVAADTLDLSKVLRVWILGEERLSQIVITEELEVNMTFRCKNIDGSKSYSINCPVDGCKHKFRILHKGYPQNYKHKKVNTKKLKTGKSRWHITAVKSHLLKIHSNPLTEEDDDRGESETSQDLPPANNANSSTQESENLTESFPTDDNNLTPASQVPSKTNLLSSLIGTERRSRRRKLNTTIGESSILPPKKTKKMAKTSTEPPSLRRKQVRRLN